MSQSNPLPTEFLIMFQENIIKNISSSTSSEIIDREWIKNQLLKILNKLPEYFVSDEQIETLIRGVSDRIDVVVHEAGVIVNNTKTRVPWYTSERISRTERIFWESFETYIRNKNDIPESVIKQTNLDTDKTLEQLCDPTSDTPFLCRGMVIGDVQAGKTLNYSALINKACDMGYKLIIVLTGLTEDLRSQTQKRLDRDFVGQESISNRNGVNASAGNRIGVGVSRNSQTVMVLTDKNTDFKKPRVLNIDENQNQVLIVAKKNKAILEEINEWIRTQNSGGRKLKSPVLIIDDEADNASVNTAKANQEPRAINKAIREILTKCERVSYVAYTATPFANIFITPDDEVEANEMKDLFPEDFIIALNPPSNYRGGKFFFTYKDEEDSEYHPTKPILDAESKISLSHKKDDLIQELPQSLKDAIGIFFIAAAIKDIRRKNGKINISNPDNKFDTLLINVSRFTNVQDLLRHLVSDQIDLFHNSIKANAGLMSPIDNNFNYLKCLFDGEYAEDLAGKITWPEVCMSLLDMEKPKVVVIHGKSDDAMHWDDVSPKKIVAIGGFRLSRGLTLSGLTVSYLYRNSLMYDTLMQMGRWFGYRDGYEDLLRLWCSPASIDWYSHITNATEELRAEVAQMAKQKMTPNDFGLRVRSHPDLLVTAKNKMQTSVKVPVKLSFSGMNLETYAFDLDIERNIENKTLVLELFKNNISKNKTGPAGQEKHFFIGDVSGNEVIPFLKNFNVHVLNGAWADKELFNKYLDYVHDSDLSTWDLCVFNKNSGKSPADAATSELSNLIGRPLYSQNRTVYFNGLQKYLQAFFVNGNRKLSVGSIGQIGLPEGEARERPMLVLHVIEAVAPKDNLPDQLKSLPGNVYFGISVILPETKKEIKAVAYHVTQGWLRRYMPESEDLDEIVEVEEL
jgi:hypothetical protein